MRFATVFGIFLLCNLLLVTYTTVIPPGLRIAIPLVPIWLLHGTPGLITAGLAGAALLKVKAGAVAALYLGLRDGINAEVWSDNSFDTQSFKHGGGPHGGIGGGIGSHGIQGGIHGGYSRKRRSVDANGKVSEEINIGQVPIQVTYDPSLDDVLQYDQIGCGLRLVCELSSTPDENLLQDERLILNLFGRELKAPKVDSGKGKLSYSYAALLGETAKDSSTCGKVYFRCPYNAQQVMESLRNAQF